MKLFVKVKPGEGKANVAVVRALAEHLHVPTWQFSIVLRYVSGNKVVEAPEPGV